MTESSDEQYASAPGWYRFMGEANLPHGAWRWWDGTQWGAFQSDNAGGQRTEAPLYPPWFTGAVTAPRGTVTLERKRTSHLLHLVLTILTGGIWGVLVWLPLTLWHKFGPRARSVTRPR